MQSRSAREDPSIAGDFLAALPALALAPRLAAQAAAGAIQGARAQPAHAHRLRRAALAALLPGACSACRSRHVRATRCCCGSAPGRSSSRPEAGRGRRASRASAGSAWASTTSRSTASSRCSRAHGVARSEGADTTGMTPDDRPGRAAARRDGRHAARARPTSTWPTRAATSFSCTIAAYCGGAGPTGNDCRAVEASPSQGLLAVQRDEPFHHRRRRPGENGRLLPVAVRGAHPGSAGRRARLRHRSGGALPDVHRRRSRTRRRAAGAAAHRSRVHGDDGLRPGGRHEDAHRLRPQAAAKRVARAARHLHLAADAQPRRAPKAAHRSSTSPIRMGSRFNCRT